MATTLSTLKQLLTEKIGNSSTVFHDDTSRIAAINEAITNICEAYDIPQMIKKGTLAFTSGIAVIPTDYFRMVKLWYTNGSTNLEFTWMPPDNFDDQTATSALYYWTIDYNSITSGQSIYIVPNTITSCNIRYLKVPNVLSAASDQTSLPSFFDDATTYWAASILMRDEGNLQRAQDFDRKTAQSVNSAYQAANVQAGVKQNNRLRSLYEKYSILSNRTP